MSDDQYFGTGDRDKLLAEKARLEADNAAATGWGAAVGARHERIKEIDRALRWLPAPVSAANSKAPTE